MDGIGLPLPEIRERPTNMGNVSRVVLPGLLAAQSQPTRGTIDVPFDFYISGEKLPAGQYTLDRIIPTYVMLRSKDGKVQQDLYFIQTAVPVKNPPLKVIFALRDGKYYFAEVWS
jgi:hypothetical protein